jgi:hypothetical protein
MDRGMLRYGLKTSKDGSEGNITGRHSYTYVAISWMSSCARSSGVSE